MRVAYFSWETYHSIAVGGIAAHVSELACALAKRGHDIHIFTRQGDHQSAYERIDGVHYHRCSYAPHTSFITEVGHMCRAFLDAFFAEEEFGGTFDIIHAHDWLTAQVIIWLRQIRAYKFIFTVHSTEFGRSGNAFAGGDSEAISNLEWSGIYHADRVIAVSQALKNELTWLYTVPEYKINVIYNGVHCEAFDGWIDDLAVRKMYDIGPDDPIILFVGRMVIQKGPDILTECIPTMLRHYPNAKFVFAGDGGMRMATEDIAYRLGVHGSTRFLGNLNGWRLRDLFKTAECVCIPSRNEPFGIVILEAWSAGKPVVASVNGGPSEIVWHEVNGYKVEPSPQSVTWGLGTLLADGEHAQWMGRNGRLAAESVFCWEHIAEETEKTYSM